MNPPRERRFYRIPCAKADPGVSHDLVAITQQEGKV